MVRMLAGNRIVLFIVLAVVLLAVWKANGGDVGKVAESAWGALNKAADSLLQVWGQFFD